jgi:hypothetical protein
MWFALTQPPYGTSMPQSGRRPQHQKLTWALGVETSAFTQQRTLIAHRRLWNIDRADVRFALIYCSVDCEPLSQLVLIWFGGGFDRWV